MRITKLRNAVPLDMHEKVREVDLSYKEEAKVYRWILRGLSVESAIRKVQVDMEIADNVLPYEEPEKLQIAG